MGGGLMQLVAYGAQDVYLTGNPQITFFKVVYRRHTNFSIETIEHAIDSAKPGGRYTITVHRNGDLATNCALRIKLPALSNTDIGSSNSVAWVSKLGHALIKQVEIEIGGSKIDKHVSHGELTLLFDVVNDEITKTWVAKKEGIVFDASLNDNRALMRFEWQECLARLALLLYQSISAGRYLEL